MLVTAHDAFATSAGPTTSRCKAIQGISTESEAGVKRDQRAGRLHRRAEDQGRVRRDAASATGTSRRWSKAARPAATRSSIGGELFSDAMGKAGTPEGTYDGMVRHNVDTIVKALK